MLEFPFFIRLNNIPLYVYITVYLFTHQWIFGLLPLLVIINSAAMNMGEQIYMKFFNNTCLCLSFHLINK